MPDDCGELMDKYFDSWSKKEYKDTFSESAYDFSMTLPQFTGNYKPYTRVCPYCRTDPKKDTCVNCGAPQEPAKATVVIPGEHRNKFFISEPGEILKLINVGVDPSYWT